MGWRTKLKGGDEWDMFTGWRRFIHTRRKSAQAKRKHNKRARKEAKDNLRGT